MGGTTKEIEVIRVLEERDLILKRINQLDRDCRGIDARLDITTQQISTGLFIEIKIIF